jgi:hypothetical protein
MRALICHQAQPQWKTLCMSKPRRVFLMQRMSSRGMALHLVGICQFFSSLHQFTWSCAAGLAALLQHPGVWQTALLCCQPQLWVQLGLGRRAHFGCVLARR